MYCALLVAPDGDFVTDYYASTKEEVINQLVDRGSAWFFYPFEFVTTDRLGRIVDVPFGLDAFKRKSVKKVVETFRKAFEEADEKGLSFSDLWDYIDWVESRMGRRARKGGVEK